MATATMERPERAERSATQLVVVADHHRNSDLLLQAVPGCRLRSNILAGRTTKDQRTGEERIPADQARFLGQLPSIPGMTITVDLAKSSYRIADPLHTDEDLCDRIKSAINRVDGNMFRISGQLRGTAPVTGTLDPHRFKTLVRELCWLIDSGDAKVVKGARPTDEEVSELPGHFLLNPGSMVANGQPQFEKDFPAWIERMHSMGG